MVARQVRVLGLAVLGLSLGPTEAIAQSLNIDLGTACGVPADTYGAAANQPGVWNGIAYGAITQPLVDLSGHPTGVSLVYTVANGPGDSDPVLTGDDKALLGDGPRFTEYDPSYFLTGLEPGQYHLYTYSSRRPAFGFAIQIIYRFLSPDPQEWIGSWSGAHTQGDSYALHRITFAGGDLHLGGGVVNDGILDGFQLVRVENVVPFCFGSEGPTPGCTLCPCGNDQQQSNFNLRPGGCRNESGAGAVLVADGVPSLSGDSLRFIAFNASANTFGTLFSASNRLPANPTHPCFGLDTGIPTAGGGLRCIGGSLRRHGQRAFDHEGVTHGGWGMPDGPAVGVLANALAAAGQIIHFQLIYRDDPAASCGTGLNSSQGCSVTVMP